jgi:translocation and assembly module TamB
MLDRFGVTSDLRGRVSIAVEVGEAARTLQASVDVAALRGGPVILPIDVHVDAAVGDRETTAILSVRTTGTPLLEAKGRLPGSLAALVQQLRRRGTDPAAANAIPLAATVQLPSVDAPSLLAVFGRTEVIGGRIDGSIELGGTVGAPSVKANLVATGIKVPPGRGGKPIRSVERLAITGGWDGDTIKLDVDGKESAGGALTLALAARSSALRDGSLTLKATKLDLVPILAFLPGPAGGAGGELGADLRITGLDPRTMQITGELHLLGARLPIAPSVGTLREAKIDAVIADHQITLGVDGKLGAGTLAVTGTVALDGAAPNGGKAKITLRKVSPIGAVQPQISADITATLSRDRNQWRADLVVDRGNVVVSSDRGERLKPVGAPTDMRFADDARDIHRRRPLERKVPDHPIFLVNVTLHSTHVESEEFRGLIKGKLEIRADGNAIGLVGGIDADNGDLDLFGRRYDVERAGVHFDGSLDPLLDVRITHNFSDVTTVTEVRGRMSKPELAMSSDPGTYSQGQLLGFLLGGDPAGDPQSGAASDKVADAGASFVANQLGGYVRKALPISIDVLRYESATATSSAAVTVGTWLTRTLFLSYRQHLASRADENSSEGSIEYWLSRQIVIEGTAGDPNSGVDLLWRKRY